MSFTWPRWPALPALALGAVATLWTVRAAMTLSGGALVYGADDVYIEMALARTLAFHGVWGVTPDAFAGIGTSLAWPLLLAVAFRVTVAEWWPLVLAAAASVSVVVASAAILRRYLSLSVQAAVLLAVTFGVSLPALTMLGMEHPLQLLVTIALAGQAARVLAQDTEPTRLRTALQLGCLAAMAMAVRYDNGAVVFGVIVIAGMRRQWRVALCVAAGALLPVASYAAVAAAHAWPLVPVTLGKARVAAADLHTLTGWWHLAVAGPLTTLWRAPYLLALVAAALALLWRPLPTPDVARARECRVLLWLFVMVAGAQIVLGAPAGHGDYRYDAWVVGLGVVATGASAGLGDWRGRPAAWIAAGLVVVLLTMHGVAVARQSLENVRVHFTTARQVGLLLRDAELPPYPAVHELGATTWLTVRPVLDLEGLSTPDVRMAMQAGDWTPARFSALAASLGTRVAAGYGVADEPFPVTWRRVGEWWADGKLQYAFLAADPDSAAALRAALAAHDVRLPAGVTRVDRGW